MKTFFRIAAVILPFWLAGCAAHRETVRIESQPPGATVRVNGEERGTTPLDVELATRGAHTVRLERLGFVTTEVRLVPVQNPERQGYVRLGPRVQSGYYKTFAQNPVEVVLRSNLVPATRGMGGLGGMAERVRTADAMLEEGVITGEDHALVIKQIMGAYP